MKVAFHFDSAYPKLGVMYGRAVETAFFRTILTHRNLNISSKVFEGDLLMDTLAEEEEQTSEGTIFRVNKDRFLEAFETWIRPEVHTWARMHEKEIIKCVAGSRIFVLCLESIDLNDGEVLAHELERLPYYLGALEVEESSSVHWTLYSQLLGARYRLLGKGIHLLWEGIEDSKDSGQLIFLKSLGFDPVEFELSAGKYTMFATAYNDFEYARRTAEWKRRCGNLLAFVADNVVARLADIIPDLADKLWSALRAMEEAETDEQIAQMMSSCRRIIGDVAEAILPPLNQAEKEKHDLRKGKVKNQLLKFADKQLASKTNIEVITTSLEVLDKQIDALLKLANKGVHAKVRREEGRRCLLRTILLLDDLVALKKGPFEAKPKLDNPYKTSHP